MTDYSIAFNRKIKEMKSENPDNVAIKALENWMVKNKHFDYYAAVEGFSYQFGIGIFSEPHINPKDDSVTYIPCLKYYNDNDFGVNERLVPLVNDENKTTLVECYVRLTKGIIYELMTLKKINSLAKN